MLFIFSLHIDFFATITSYTRIIIFFIAFIDYCFIFFILSLLYDMIYSLLEIYAITLFSYFHSFHHLRFWLHITPLFFIHLFDGLLMLLFYFIISLLPFIIYAIILIHDYISLFSFFITTLLLLSSLFYFTLLILRHYFHYIILLHIIILMETFSNIIVRFFSLGGPFTITLSLSSGLNIISVTIIIPFPLHIAIIFTITSLRHFVRRSLLRHIIFFHYAIVFDITFHFHFRYFPQIHIASIIIFRHYYCYATLYWYTPFHFIAEILHAPLLLLPLFITPLSDISYATWCHAMPRSAILLWQAGSVKCRVWRGKRVCAVVHAACVQARCRRGAGACSAVWERLQKVCAAVWCAGRCVQRRCAAVRGEGNRKVRAGSVVKQRSTATSCNSESHGTVRRVARAQ